MSLKQDFSFPSLSRSMSLKEVWLVYLDTSDEPIKIKASSRAEAQAYVQFDLDEEGMGELNVGPIGLVKIVKASEE